MIGRKPPCCSFCGKPPREGIHVMQQQRVRICSRCARFCADYLDRQERAERSADELGWLLHEEMELERDETSHAG